MGRMSERHNELEQQAIDDGEDLMLAEQHYYSVLNEAAELVANDEKALKDFNALAFKNRN